MKKTIQKYTERLATLKENRARTVDTNTDAENELYDQLIKQAAEFVRDIKQLNILHVSNSVVCKINMRPENCYYRDITMECKGCRNNANNCC